MAKFKEFFGKLVKNVIVRNIVLALSAVILLVFLANILLNLFTRHNVYEEVPDFSNMKIDYAMEQAAENSLKMEVNDSLYVPGYEPGTVLMQNPEPGTNVKSGRRIFVTINSMRQKMVRIPYVTGYSLRQAKNILEIAGLEIANLEYRSDIATNYVLETNYKGEMITRDSNLEVEQGAGITLVAGVKKSENTCVIPKVVGLSFKEAKGRLWEVGLNVGAVAFDEGISLLERNTAKVYSQQQQHKSIVELGTPVEIHLTLDPEKLSEGHLLADREALLIVAARDGLMVSDSMVMDSLFRRHDLGWLFENMPEVDSVEADVIENPEEAEISIEEFDNNIFD